MTKKGSHPSHAILFDLDGTLINSAPDVRLAVNYVLAQFNQDPIPENHIYELMGSGAKAMLKKLFTQRNVIVSEEQFKGALVDYLNYYKAHAVVDSKIYPNVIPVLMQLKQAGFLMGICTNKPGITTHLVLEQLNLKHFFSAIVAGDEIPQSKPHASHIFTVLEKMQASHCKSVMVGDSEIDKQAALNANIPFIGVSYGYDIKSLDEHFCIDHFSDLPHALTNLKDWL